MPSPPASNTAAAPEPGTNRYSPYHTTPSLPGTPPTRGDIGVIALVSEPWSMRWQPRHHVLTRLARRFHVVWVSPAHEWRAIMRRRPPVEPFAHLGLPGFTVYRPELWLPHVYRPAWLGAALFRRRLRCARAILRKRGCTRIVLHLWHYRYASAIAAIGHDLSCYYIDDEYSFSEVECPIDPAEHALLERVDQVFIHSRTLLEKKGGLNPHTMFTPNGVHYEAFARAEPEPRDLAPIPRPRIGYIGYVKKQLDWALLATLARTHPGWSFVFVGKRSPHPEIAAALAEMAALPNVHFLGERPTPELAKYPQHFDVCLMPYRATAYTAYIYPLKLHEYLATGRPVVGTRIPALEEFDGLVRLADGAAEWSRAIAASLEPDASSPERCAARQAEARRHDWDLLVSRIADCMEQRLAERLAGSERRALPPTTVPAT